MSFVCSFACILFMLAPSSPIDVIVASNELIEEVQVLEYSDTVVVALITEPVFQRSVRKSIVESVKQSVRENYDIREVIVTFDADLYYRIARVNNHIASNNEYSKLAKEIADIINTAKYRVSNEYY